MHWGRDPKKSFLPIFSSPLLLLPQGQTKGRGRTNGPKWAEGNGGKGGGETEKFFSSPLLSPKKGPEQRPLGPPFQFSASARVNVLSLVYGWKKECTYVLQAGLWNGCTQTNWHHVFLRDRVINDTFSVDEIKVFAKKPSAAANIASLPKAGLASQRHILSFRDAAPLEAGGEAEKFRRRGGRRRRLFSGVILGKREGRTAKEFLGGREGGVGWLVRHLHPV